MSKDRPISTLRVMRAAQTCTRNFPKNPLLLTPSCLFARLCGVAVVYPSGLRPSRIDRLHPSDQIGLSWKAEKLRAKVHLQVIEARPLTIQLTEIFSIEHSLLCSRS